MYICLHMLGFFIIIYFAFGCEKLVRNFKSAEKKNEIGFQKIFKYIFLNSKL